MERGGRGVERKLFSNHKDNNMTTALDIILSCIKSSFSNLSANNPHCNTTNRVRSSVPLSQPVFSIPLKFLSFGLNLWVEHLSFGCLVPLN